MRTTFAITFVAAGMALAVSPAAAGGDHLVGRTYGEDPYAYRFELPRYYPYYNSGYWVSREAMRYRYRYDTVLPPYQSSWGYPAPAAKTVGWWDRPDRAARR